MILKKFIKSNGLSGSAKLVKRYFQTVRHIEPKRIPPPPTTAAVKALGLDSLRLGQPQTDIENVTSVLPKELKVASLLEDVKAVDGLPQNPSHIEHLVGRATKGKIYQKHGLFPQEKERIQIGNSFPGITAEVDQTEKYEVGGIDIAEKTQLILQSPHPVRYVIEK